MVSSRRSYGRHSRRGRGSSGRRDQGDEVRSRQGGSRMSGCSSPVEFLKTLRGTQLSSTVGHRSGHGGLMQPHDIVRRLGGGAWRRVLIEAGSWDDIIDMSVSFGRLRRVRRGLYVLPDISEAAVIALRVGGRLACISSLAHHGMRVAEAGEPVHVELPRTASRLRLPIGRQVVLHWTRRRHPGTRLTVSAAVARSQAAVCGGLA